MTPDEREEIEDKIGALLESMELIRETMQSGAMPPENLHRAHNKLGNRERSIGIYQLIEGKGEEAKRQFRSSIEHHLTSLELERENRESSHGYRTWESEPLKIQNMLFEALLSQSEEMIDRVIEKALDIPDSYTSEYADTRPWFDFVKSLAALLLENEETLREHLTGLEEHADVFERVATAEMTLQYRGLATTIGGIADQDSERVASGILDILPYHEEESDPDSIKSGDLVSLPAAAMFVLALMFGLDPQVESRYIPEILDSEYVEVYRK